MLYGYGISHHFENISTFIHVKLQVDDVSLCMSKLDLKKSVLSESLDRYRENLNKKGLSDIQVDQNSYKAAFMATLSQNDNKTGTE